MCLISVPHNGRPGDDRGKSYLVVNLRTKATWNLGDSQHMCGGQYPLGLVEAAGDRKANGALALARGEAPQPMKRSAWAP